MTVVVLSSGWRLRVDLRQPTGDFFYGCGLPPSPSLRPAKFFSNAFTALSLRFRTLIKPRRFRVQPSSGNSITARQGTPARGS
jgi:hypothetical protein